MTGLIHKLVHVIYQTSMFASAVHVTPQICNMQSSAIIAVVIVQMMINLKLYPANGSISIRI